MGENDADVAVRTASVAEYDAVGELTVEVYVGEGYVRADTPYAAQLADARHRGAAAQILVAVHAGRVVGSLTVARPGTDYAEIARAGELEFRMLAVSKAARGLGAGTALVRTVIETAAAEGFHAVVLTTMPAMAEARRIYDRYGFVPVPERDRTTDTGEDLTVLRLELPAA
ncbi:GNAT family N-acetyltransferase [Nocardia noduli]|uniref:GNAT family N-acetyltransferase n=1 Tax=Nocardia noduli TaxID=2815722 RepID=UPI001C24D2AB|nr:GNAT family N-acetyltransferase [Nocardia noduli]